MAFKKGDSRINREGRPKGSPNKTTEELRGMLADFIEHNWESVQETWEALEGKERLMFLEKVIKYVVPQPVVSIDQFSDEDLQILLRRLEEKRLKFEN
jgi:hypothetical protein